MLDMLNRQQTGSRIGSLKADPLFPVSLLIPVPLLGDIVNSVCRSFVLDTYGGVTAALKRAFALQPAVEDRSVQVVIEVTKLGRRTGFWRLVSGVRKGGLVPIQECERDKTVDSQKAVPAIHQDAFPNFLSYQSIATVFPSPPVPIGGERNWTGATPPFLPPGSAR